MFQRRTRPCSSPARNTGGRRLSSASSPGTAALSCPSSKRPASCRWRCARRKSSKTASLIRASASTSGPSPRSRSGTTLCPSPTPPAGSWPSRSAWRSSLAGVFAGHLRSIVGGLTVEQIIRERDRVAQEVKEGSHAEMEKLGIVVDALEIQEIEDASGYINNLAAPHAAAVASQARIAKAKADQEATEREFEAASMKAQFERDMAIKRAGFL